MTSDAVREDSEAVVSEDPQERTLRWLEDIRQRPLTDEQAVSLAQAYTSLAALEQHRRQAEALSTIARLLSEDLVPALEKFSGTLSEALAGREGMRVPPSPENVSQARTARSRASSTTKENPE